MDNDITFKSAWPDTQVLRVTAEGEFQWHEDADRMIEEGDFSGAPAAQHILRVLRRKWVGLTDEEMEDACPIEMDRRLDSFARAIEAKLRSKNS